MRSVLKIDPPVWMIRPETVKLMAALEAGAPGGAHGWAQGGADTPQALFVGGCVRNSVLGRAVADVDIATRLMPDQVVMALERAGIKAIPTGIDHGTITAVINGHAFEITTLRKDVETMGRRAVVAFTRDWAEDAQRRDFTMNTLLADTDGHVYDPTGQGVADLQAGRVRFVGDAATRIAEDYLRILRFFRFHAWYGHGAPDADALAACRAAAAQVGTLSRERIMQEFFKILMHDKAAAHLGLMFENNVLPDMADASYDPAVLDRLCALQALHDAPDTMARLVVLCGDGPACRAVWDKYLVLSNVRRTQAEKIMEALSVCDNVSEKSAKLLIYKYGREIATQAVLISLALEGRADAEGVVTFMTSWPVPVFPLDGDDLIEAGIKPGPRMGHLLSTVESWWINGDFRGTRESCLRRLREIAGA